VQKEESKPTLKAAISPSHAAGIFSHAISRISTRGMHLSIICLHLLISSDPDEKRSYKTYLSISDREALINSLPTS
jgi:hypothetical protein